MGRALPVLVERVLDTYALPYNPHCPVLCFDERPCYLIEQTLQPMPVQSGQVKREDYHYKVKASCYVLLAVEPLTGKRWARLYDHRRRQEYTEFLQYLNAQFPQARKIKLVQDNLNTHTPGSFYASLEPEQAFALTERFEMIYTPKHASWLNMAELEFSALSKQCLDRRIAERSLLESELNAWLKERNQVRIKLNWQFSKEDARATFRRAYDDIRVS